MIKIKLDKFEGPLSLLLRLIEKEEMDITEVSLAAVADQYIDYIRRSGQINPEEMADFLVVAALLPYLYPEEEEEIEELEEQLRMYKEFLEAAKKIEKMVGQRKFMFSREFNRRILLTNSHLFSPPPKLTARELKIIFVDLLARLKPPEALPEETLDHKIKIEDKILLIQKMLLERLRVSFSRVLSTAKSKTEIIVSFLAVLELMRQREVVLRQDNLFGEILIEKAT